MIRQAANQDVEVQLRAASTSAADFAAQFQASFRVLWLIAVGIVGESATAEDVVQEAAIIALGKLDQYQAGTNFTAWTGQIVRNVALNRARRDRRQRAGTVELSPAGDVQAVAKRQFGANIERGPRVDFDQRLVQALGGVGDIARACLLLRTLEGMEYAHIAQLLGIPEGTAMSHVHRTRRYLRERLADLWKERLGAESEFGE